MTNVNYYWVVYVDEMEVGKEGLREDEGAAVSLSIIVKQPFMFQIQVMVQYNKQHVWLIRPWDFTKKNKKT